MDAKVHKASLLNSYAAADIATDTSVVPNLIRIPGLLPMRADKIISVREEAAVAETRQVYTLGLATVPTIVASTKYQLRVGNALPRTEGWNGAIPFFGYTSPSSLSGTAATDRHLAYKSLASKINSNPAVYADAYPLITLNYDGQTGNFTVGLVVTGGTSGASGIIIADTDAGATGTLTIALTTLSTDFANNEVITDTSTGSADVNGTQTNGIGLRIVDQAGYYQDGRGGVNTVLVTAGFTSAMLVETTAGVVARGQGSDLLNDVPTKEALSDNLTSGTWEMATNNAPVAGNAYSKFHIVEELPASMGGLGGGAETITRTQVLYLYNGEGDFGATRTAVLALD